MAYEITKNTKITTSVATLLLVGGFLWKGFVVASEVNSQVQENARGLKASLLRDVKQDIRYYRTEEKKILLHEEQNGTSPLSKELLKDLEHAITDLEKQEKCLTEGGDLCDG